MLLFHFTQSLAAANRWICNPLLLATALSIPSMVRSRRQTVKGAGGHVQTSTTVQGDRQMKREDTRVEGGQRGHSTAINLRGAWHLLPLSRNPEVEKIITAAQSFSPGVKEVLPERTKMTFCQLILCVDLKSSSSSCSSALGSV